MSEQFESTEPTLDQEFFDQIDIALGNAEKPYSGNSSISGFPESVVKFIKGENVGTIDRESNEFTIAQLKEGKKGLPAERVSVLMDKLAVDVAKGIPVINTDVKGDWPIKGDQLLIGAVFPTKIKGLTMVYRQDQGFQSVVLTREKAS